MASFVESLDVRPVVAELIEANLETIERRYGPEGEHPLSYHNTKHTLDVLRRSDAIARACGMSIADREIILCAASGHDSIHGLGAGLSEAASAKELRQRMRKMGGFTAQEVVESSLIVNCSSYHFEDGRLVQHAIGKKARVLDDADLGGIGEATPLAWAGTYNLYLEHGGSKKPNFKNMEKFIQSSIRMFSAHRFFLPVTEVLYPHRKDNVVFMKNVIKTGKIPKPEELLAA